MKTMLTFNQKLAVIQELTGGEGPIATAAVSAVLAQTTEYERHLRCVHHTLEVFEEMAWKRCCQQYGALVEHVLESKAGMVI